MQPMAQAFPSTKQADPELSINETTLYELIHAISEEVQPGEDGLLAEVVLDLLETDQIKLLGTAFRVKSS